VPRQVPRHVQILPHLLQYVYHLLIFSFSPAIRLMHGRSPFIDVYTHTHLTYYLDRLV
jgi:hypothetical protein